MHQKRSILAISGGRFIFEFFPPEFLEKYFQPKRSPNSPAPVKKSKKSRPRETPLNLAILCLQGMKKLEYNNSVSVSLFPGFNRFLLELSYIPSMASMYLARSWILAKKSVYRRYNNYAIFFGGFFFDMSHRKMKKGHGRA